MTSKRSAPRRGVGAEPLAGNSASSPVNAPGSATDEPSSKSAAHINEPPSIRTPRGNLREVEIFRVLEDDVGQRFLQRASKVSHVVATGAPRKTARDAALTLHYERLLSGSSKRGEAQATIAKLFRLKKPSQVQEIAKRARASTLAAFPISGFTIGSGDRTIGTERGEFMFAFRRVAESPNCGEGFLCAWGTTAATYGLFQLVKTSLGPGFELIEQRPIPR